MLLQNQNSHTLQSVVFASFFYKSTYIEVLFQCNLQTKSELYYSVIK